VSVRRYATLAGLALGPVLVLAVFFVLPVSAMIGRGFDDGPGAVLEVLGRDRTHRVIWFTVWSAGLATAVSVALGLPAAYVLHRLDFPGRGALRSVLLVPFVLPTVVVGVAFRLLVRGTPFDGSPVAIVAGLVFFNVAVVIRVVGAAWETLDPRPAEAAAALGATPAQVFRTVSWPALRPAVVSAASVVFLFCAT
jgi:thiamine transport system permease protein